jgi:hypothetical protein
MPVSPSTPVHSFTSLLRDLATIANDRVQTHGARDPGLDMVTRTTLFNRAPSTAQRLPVASCSQNSRIGELRTMVEDHRQSRDADPPGLLSPTWG